ncbi:MAG: tRNA preQ1(34) S-adenosylmethionine ribosyltransferase-isomerase QueA [Betaproteobacteria bacterium]
MTPRYRLQDFAFELPAELIAQAPPAQRSDSRLLRVDSDARVDGRFVDLPHWLARGDLVVFNDTRVIKARVRGTKPTGGRVEMLVERIDGDHAAWAQLRASHLPQVGTTIAFPGAAIATVRTREGRFFHLAFDMATPVAEWLDAHGTLPLPPYITRVADSNDDARYQTVYARHPGAVAAPTAGLHFDPPLLAALADAGIGTAYVTLHVGAGTFHPVTHDDLTRHRMHNEHFVITSATADAIGAARARGANVVAIGTTTLRALESAADDDGHVAAGAAQTSLFITPGYRFRVVDRLVTNFHLPHSTLLMLVSAFAGYDAIRRAYAHAIAARYRFFSYGDAMLLSRAPPAPPQNA